ANRIVQSIVDADTAPAKRASFRRLIETEISNDPETRQHQLDENPGLWIRLNSNVRSLILPNVLTCDSHSFKGTKLVTSGFPNTHNAIRNAQLSITYQQPTAHPV